MRMHRKVWLWWGRWWAVQLMCNPYLSLGIHVDLWKPYLDIHIGWLILSVGRNPVMTPVRDRFRGSCRGFLFSDAPVL